MPWIIMYADNIMYYFARLMRQAGKFKNTFYIIFICHQAKMHLIRLTLLLFISFTYTFVNDIIQMVHKSPFIIHLIWHNTAERISIFILIYISVECLSTLLLVLNMMLAEYMSWQREQNERKPTVLKTTTENITLYYFGIYRITHLIFSV